MVSKCNTSRSGLNKNYTEIVNCLQAAAERFALPALGRGRRSRPTGKMLRRRKMLGMCADSPASGARFVGQWLGDSRFLRNNFVDFINRELY